MALRAFQNNPSIGGFGNESGGLMTQTEGNQGCYSIPTSCSNDHGHKDCIKKTNDHNKIKLSSPSGLKKSNYQKNSGDAFAQILKELVDNAVDACNIRDAEDSGGNDVHSNKANADKSEKGTLHHKSLKRVRVSIEKVKLSAPRTNPYTNSNNVGSFDNVNDEKEERTFSDQDENLLRVTVSDTGCGMADIEKCVSAFSTSKMGTGLRLGSVHHCEESNSTQHQLHGSDKENSDPSSMSCDNNTSHQPLSPTAGRYGIGLTLCLLHAQRLVPNSCASITSSTTSQRNWTIAKFVVDADRDTVVCVEKKYIEKKKDVNESGTAVSLLVPDGIEAQKAWPRLAEYFARFQLSFRLQCSLQVMAPSLSPCPLFIRPTCEMKGIKEKERESNEKDYHTVLGIDHCLEEREIKDKQNISLSVSSSKLNEVNDDIEDWIDRIQREEVEESSSIEDHKKNQTEKQEFDKATDENLWVDNLNDDDGIDQMQDIVQNQENKHNLNHEKILSSSNKELNNNHRRKLIQSGVSSYLQQSIPLENIVSSSQKIRIDGTSMNNESNNHPSLEVDMIVCDNEDLNNEDENYDEDNNDNSDINTDPKVAKIFLIRMVNQIPLLDGAEASACGIVQGIARNRSMWNSFGLEVAQLSQQAHPCSQSFHNKNASMITNEEYSSSYYLYMPTFSLRDSANVAPYFVKNCTHALFEDEESSCTSVDDDSIETGRKRKKAEKILLLPAGLRLGKILIIVHLQATPNQLPLPTLSKGRLPMNNKAIDDALELGITSCLQCLQKSKPSLLLDAPQLKKTEREVRFVPSVALALASIVLNCDNLEQKEDMIKVMKGWHPSPKENIKFPVILPNTIGEKNKLIEGNDSLNVEPSESPTLEKMDERTNSYRDTSLVGKIQARFHEVMNLIEERKVEQNKRAKAEYSLKRKKIRCHEDSDNSSCNSVADLDDFFSGEKSDRSILDDSNSISQSFDPQIHTKTISENESRDVISKSDEDDFDDDEWW